MDPNRDKTPPPEETDEAEFPAIPHPPPPPPIPEVLRGSTGEDRPAKAAGGSGYSDTTRAWGVAMDFVFTIIGALLLGYFSDKWFQTAPRWTIVGLVLGFSFALWRIIRRTLAEDRRERERREKQKSGSQ